MKKILRMRPTRLPHLCFAAGAAVLFWGAAAGAADLSSGTPDLSGIWLNTAPASVLKPLGAALPPFTPAGRRAYDKARAALKSGKAVDLVHKYCLPEGVPRLMSAAYPFAIVQSPSQVTMVHESHHTFRIVLMNAKHPSEDEALGSFMGDSVGRWDGNALVIDTIQFNDTAPLDAAGLPHGEKLHVTERLSRTPDGRGLVDLITIEDPQFYARPWTVKASFQLRPDLSLQEYTCGEPHRDLSKVIKP